MKKELQLSRTTNPSKSRNPTTVATANGEVQTCEEAPVNVYELDLRLAVQILQDTPTVMSVGKLCEAHGENSRVGQWSKATSDQECEKNSV